MAVVKPFRITPNLGPSLTSTSAENFWDTIRPPGAEPSYQPGTTMRGSDGHLYIYVKAHADLTLNQGVGIDEEPDWVSKTGTTHKAAAAVAEGDYFHARKNTV